MKRKKLGSKKMEFSKKILTGVTLFVILVTLFSMIMIWRTNDLTPLNYIIGGAFAELATATGFYYNKAKHENINKYRGNTYDE